MIGVHGNFGLTEDALECIDIFKESSKAAKWSRSGRRTKIRKSEPRFGSELKTTQSTSLDTTLFTRSQSVSKITASYELPTLSSTDRSQVRRREHARDGVELPGPTSAPSVPEHKAACGSPLAHRCSLGQPSGGATALVYAIAGME